MVVDCHAEPIGTESNSFRPVVNYTACVDLQMEKPQFTGAGGDKMDEEFTMARLYISKVKSEVKSLVQRCSQLEIGQAENQRRLAETEKILSDSKLVIQQVHVFVSLCVLVCVYVSACLCSKC